MVGTVRDIAQIEEFRAFGFRIAIQNDLVFWRICGNIMARINAVLVAFTVEMEIGIGAIWHGDAACGWFQSVFHFFEYCVF